MRCDDVYRNDQHAWISNIAFPTSIEELLHVLRDGEGLYDTELIAGEHNRLLWTVPIWARKGDIIFFMHSVSAISKIRKLRGEIRKTQSQYSQEELELMECGIDRALQLYTEFGGKLIGTARLDSDPIRGYTESFRHWKGQTYATITGTHAFSRPLERERFKERITICRTGGVTQIHSEQFRFLCDLLAEDNELPDMLTEAVLYSCDPHHYTTEEGFRALCVDKILRTISHEVYRECRCRKTGVPDSFADNLILTEGKYLPVEIKVSWSMESIKDQLWKYCNNDAIEIAPEGKMLMPYQLWTSFALLIDPDAVYIYDSRKNALKKLLLMEDVRSDPFELRDLISSYISEDNSILS